MKRIFKTRFFNRWARKAKLSDHNLCRAINEVEGGLVDAVLSGGLIKKRIAVSGKGKRGGARVILAGERTLKWFFLYGFMKNERENINQDELDALIIMATDLKKFPTQELEHALENGTLVEVKYEH